MTHRNQKVPRGCGRWRGQAVNRLWGDASFLAWQGRKRLAKARTSVLNGEALSEFDPQTGHSADREIRSLMSSGRVQAPHARGLPGRLPTGALFPTEFGTIVVQGDICNGCGYCVPSCPYGVIDQRKDDGRVFKCTLCYDRLTDGLTPACATACPTQSVQFATSTSCRPRRHPAGDAAGAGRRDRPAVRTTRTTASAATAFFLLLDEPEVYGLPPDPIVTSSDLPVMWKAAGKAAAMMVGVAVTAILGSRRR
ncbi:4Fe-4S dicluster domain-containing protein [Blastococcus mobilis]|uniref:4Fe-4S dicluster domain-containing protein n=2 Tax=Blastococcus mobilis TaxID=1938746 RepID=A0A238WIX8_9ACTN|nr:4Fe-4S dicluster domain-containing protein [Blastococcus mobilis]